MSFNVLGRSSWVASRSYGGAACVLWLLLAVGAVQGQEPVQAEADRRVDSDWVVVKEWTGGNGTRTTEVFVPTGTPWRVSYKATGGDRWGLLDIYVRTTDGEDVGKAISLQPFGFGEAAGAGSFLVDSAHDAYVLEIIGYDLQWHVVVEQRR